MSALPEGVQNQGQFTRGEIKLKVKVPGAAKLSDAGEITDAKKYTLLNAIGSPVLEDGKYLYNPATGQIEIQWTEGIGSEKAAAPQGRLMATVINGILSRRLPWGLVLLGVALVIGIELLGVRSLTFAVGAYLSIGTTLAIFCGGVARWLVDRAMEKSGEGAKTEAEAEVSSGSLYASGLIASGGIMGLVGVATQAMDMTFPHFSDTNPFYNRGVSVICFALLGFSLYYFARKPIPSEAILEQVENEEI
jgi:hypothetical protein